MSSTPSSPTLEAASPLVSPTSPFNEENIDSLVHHIVTKIAMHNAPEIGLADEWTFYFDNNKFDGNSAKSYFDSMVELGSFNSIQNFWRFYNEISSKMSLMPSSYNLRLFKKNVKPLWEDPNNVNGGQWTIRCPPMDEQAMQIWFEMLLATVGDQLPRSAEVVSVP